MNRQYIATFAIFIVLAGVCGAVYQFYFKERLQTYADNREKYEKLSAQLKRIGTVFNKTKPDAVVSMWSGAVVPWRDAVAARTSFFDIKEVYEADPPPEGVILRFYYENESNRLISQLYQAAASRNPPCELPPIVHSYFGSPSMDQLTGRTVTKEDVIDWLRQIRLGCQITKLLLDAGVYQIHEITMWPKRIEDQLLEMQTSGVAFNASAKNLYTFMDKIRLADHYINHNSMKISNQNLLMVEPVLEIQMLITQSHYVAPAPGKGPVLAAPARPGATTGPIGMAARTTSATGGTTTTTTSTETEEKSWWQKLWPF